MLVASIDIKDGKIVQLRQGKEFVLECDRDPAELACEFNRFGEVAVIDLDAAMGTGNNIDIVKNICKVADVRAGGGIREAERGKELLKAGANKLIFGTAATPELLSQFPSEVVTVALDQKNGTVFDKGWVNSTGENVFDRASRLSPYCGSFLTTFIEHEGGMGGMSIASVVELKEKLDKPLTVAGGIATTKEIVDISKLGVDVQVGMALYKGKIDPIDSVIGVINFNKDGLCPTIVQDIHGQVLMLAYSSAESLRAAIKEGKGIYYSRSRSEIWEKGLTSGNSQRLKSCRLDCDHDTVLFTVEQTNAACHNNTYSCFDKKSKNFSLDNLFETLKSRKSGNNESSYTASLFKDREKLIEKIKEESVEVINFSDKENLRWEIADLIYFLSVLAVAENIDWLDIERELGARRK